MPGDGAYYTTTRYGNGEGVNTHWEVDEEDLVQEEYDVNVQGLRGKHLPTRGDVGLKGIEQLTEGGPKGVKVGVTNDVQLMQLGEGRALATPMLTGKLLHRVSPYAGGVTAQELHLYTGRKVHNEAEDVVEGTGEVEDVEICRFLEV